MKNKLYIKSYECYGIVALYALVNEIGDVLYTHHCTGPEFAYGDLIGNRFDRQAELDSIYGEGNWEVHNLVRGVV